MTTKKRKKPTGRPAYKPTPQHAKLIYEAAKKGGVNTEFAKMLGIGSDCFYRNISYFKESIKKGRAEGDSENIQLVKNALLIRCLGKEYTEEHVEKWKDAEGTPREKTKMVTKWLPPDPTSIFFYLVNKSNGEFISINQPNISLGENIDDKLAEIARAIESADSNSIRSVA